MKVNGKQSVKLKSGSIKFDLFLKQLALPFKFYTDFLKWIHGDDTNNNASYTKKHQGHVPWSFAYKSKF